MSKASLRPIVIAVLAVAACGEPTGPRQVRVELDWLTADLARAVDSQGRFVFPTPVQPPDQVDEPRARVLAVALARFIGIAIGNTRADLERSHGASIAWQRLAPCDRAFFALPSYGPPPQSLPDYSKRSLVGYWVIPLCAPNGMPQITVSVSLGATNLEVVNGIPQFQPFVGGEEFTVYAVPRGHRGRGIWVQPERAVAIVVGATGAKVAALPAFVERGRADGRKFFPDISRWRIKLDRPVVVSGVRSGERYTTSELWVGITPSGEELLVARGEQPDSVMWRWLHTEQTEPGPELPVTADSTKVAVRVPIQFDTVAFRQP